MGIDENELMTVAYISSERAVQLAKTISRSLTNPKITPSTTDIVNNSILSIVNANYSTCSQKVGVFGYE